MGRVTDKSHVVQKSGEETICVLHALLQALRLVGSESHDVKHTGQATATAEEQLEECSIERQKLGQWASRHQSSAWPSAATLERTLHRR